MISDSPYTVNTTVLTPWAGILSGAVSSVAMLASIGILSPVSGFGLVDALTRIGGVILTTPTTTGSTSVVLAGIGLHVFLGALMGLLYSVCQQRIPIKGLVGVGIFYGLILWVVSRLIVASILGEAIREFVRTWPWLFACLLFGLCLAITAIWSESRRPAHAVIIVPKD